MKRSTCLFVPVCLLFLCALVPVAAWAGEDDASDLRSELEALRKEVAELRAMQLGELSEAERRALLDAQAERVYDDAKRRAQALAGPAVMAGIDEKGKVFLRSEGGDFTARFNGMIQIRYLNNQLTTNNASGTRASDSLSGFAINRARFGVSGEVGDGWGYKIGLGTARAASTGAGLAVGDLVTEDTYITYDFNEHWAMRVGVARVAFTRQELISAAQQVAVDRGLANEFFTLNRSDHAELSYRNDELWARLTISDGGNANASGAFTDTSNDFAATGRVDWNVFADDWSVARNEFASDKTGLFVGGAVHYEVAEGTPTGSPDPYDDLLAWTVDALWKLDRVSLSAAVFGNHVNTIGVPDADQYGVYSQLNVLLDDGWDVFGRWEMVDDGDFTGLGTDPIQAVTAGFNHHFNSRVKLTGDVVWIYAGDNPRPAGSIAGSELSSGLGLSSTGFNAADNHGDQVVFRLQLQLVY